MTIFFCLVLSLWSSSFFWFKRLVMVRRRSVLHLVASIRALCASSTLIWISKTYKHTHSEMMSTLITVIGTAYRYRCFTSTYVPLFDFLGVRSFSEEFFLFELLQCSVPRQCLHSLHIHQPPILHHHQLLTLLLQHCSDTQISKRFLPTQTWSAFFCVSTSLVKTLPGHLHRILASMSLQSLMSLTCCWCAWRYISFCWLFSTCSCWMRSCSLISSVLSRTKAKLKSDGTEPLVTNSIWKTVGDSGTGKKGRNWW